MSSCCHRTVCSSRRALPCNLATPGSPPTQRPRPNTCPCSARLPCAAGIGRSGVFCVLDIVSQRLLSLLDSRDEAAGAAAVDLAALVAHLR